MYFIVSCGRSGSRSLAAMLDRHPDTSCKHESNIDMVSLAAMWHYGVVSEGELLKKLSLMYDNTIGESDHYLAYVIPQLRKLFPEAKFIWLMRRACETIGSMVKLGWYSDTEIIHPKTVWQRNRIGKRSQEWWGMSQMERCVWYWGYTFMCICKGLEGVNWLPFYLETPKESYESALRFLGLGQFEQAIPHLNKSYD